MKYKVLTNMAYGWDETWSDRFDSILEAHNEIEDFIEGTQEAYKLGHLSEPYHKEDYKIVEANTPENVYDYIVGCKI